MGIRDSIKKFQDAARDSGWRIESINWRADGKIEQVLETSPKFIKYAARLSALVFFLATVSIFTGWPVWAKTYLFYSLGALMITAPLSHAMEFWGFVPVEAKCVDREIRGYLSGGQNGVKTRFGFRTVCEFEYEGETYRVTPESRKVWACNSAASVEKYLAKYIDEDGHCILMMNPKNLLHTVICKKRLKK
jgi:hypothetical protein